MTTVCWDQVVPSPRRHVSAAGQSGKARGDWVGAMKVVKQPSIQVRCAQGFLYSGHIKFHSVQYTARFLPVMTLFLG